MPEPIARFEFMKSNVSTQVDTSQGMPLCFIDVVTPDGFPDVSIGWSPKWDRFGVYVDGHEVYPYPDDVIEVVEPTIESTTPNPGD